MTRTSAVASSVIAGPVLPLSVGVPVMVAVLVTVSCGGALPPGLVSVRRAGVDPELARLEEVVAVVARGERHRGALVIGQRHVLERDVARGSWLRTCR